MEINREQMLEKAEALRIGGFPERAIEVCNQLIEHSPEMYSAYSERSKSFYKIGAVDDAFLDLEILLKLRPDIATPFMQMAEWQMTLGKYTKAIENLTTVLAKNDDYYRDVAVFHRIVAQIELGNYRGALIDCNALPIGFSFYAKTARGSGPMLTKEQLIDLAQQKNSLEGRSDIS